MKDEDDNFLLDLLEPFNPKMGRREPYRTLRQRLGRLPPVFGRRQSRAPKGAPRRSTIAVREPHRLARRCVIKGRYVKTTAGSHEVMKRHLAYLERDGVERDGSRGELYGADDAFSAEEFGLPLAHEQRQFRFIVSPEDGDQMDLTGFARRFMSQVEKDTERRLTWAAVNHHNTDNAHVHIIIRGVDADGDDVRIDGRYIGREMRWRAQEIITRELGLRLELDLTRGQSKEVTRRGFTEIDRMLAGHLLEDGRLARDRLADAPRVERVACLARLEVLEKMKLAHREPKGEWRLEAGWDAELKRMEAHDEARGHLSRHIPDSLGLGRVLEVGQTFDTVEGVVKGIGLHDELEGTMYLAVEGRGAVAHYVPVRPEVVQGLRVGDTVKVSTPAESWVKSTDRIIAQFAQQNRGVYDPVLHQRALEALSGRRGGRAVPSAAELTTANLRRLERLERYGLVERLPNGRWRVPVDLVAQLEARERSHPRHRIQVDRVGPEPDRDRTGPRRRGPEVSR
jgi:type IV secretory pathway VirD2 relaxase